MRREGVRRGVGGALALAALGGCSKPPPPPMDSVLVVRDEKVVGLSSPKKTGPSTLTLHQGDALVRPKSWGPLRWEGTLDGAAAKREGEILEVHRSVVGGMIFAFNADLEPATVPTAAWFCDQSPRPQQSGGAPCKDILMRIRVDGSTTACYAPCIDERCLLGLARDGRVTWTDVTRLSVVELKKLDGRPVLAARRGHHEGKVMGTYLSMIDPSPSLTTLLDVELDILDGSAHPRMRYRALKPIYEPNELVLEGDEREVDARTGEELTRRPVREVYRRRGERMERTDGGGKASKPQEQVRLPEATPG